MNKLKHNTVQIGLIFSALSIHALVFLFIALHWDRLPDSVIIHYGPGGLTLYDATSFLTVFYFSAVALELILLLAWGIATAATIFHRANTHVTARAIIPVCILLLSASFSAINLASVYGAPALSTIIATISVLVCIFIPVVATSIMGFIDTTERRKRI